MNVWLNSFVISEATNPSAESTPDSGGTITGIAAEERGERVRVQPAGAAERDERELARDAAACCTVTTRSAPSMFS